MRRKLYTNEKRAGQVCDEEQKGRRVTYTAIYKVNRSDELLEFLLRKCNTSRNNVKSLLARRQVLVNGSVVTQYNFTLAKDDEVKLSKYPIAEGAGIKTAKQVKRTAKPKILPKIIYEDEDFIAIDKPAGLLSVESDKETECAFAYVFEHLRAQEKNARPFILHRIDKETSGVLVFAKNVKIHSIMRLKWNELVTLREYHAVVEGMPEPQSNTIVSYLKENQNNLVYSTKDPTGQKAITHYTVLNGNSDYALLRVQIDTGRKNQIRVHMHEIGHPIVGDDKYGFTKNPIARLGLHATKLEFTHPVKKETISIHASVPAEFRGLFGGKQ